MTTEPVGTDCLWQYPAARIVSDDDEIMVIDPAGRLLRRWQRGPIAREQAEAYAASIIDAASIATPCLHISRATDGACMDCGDVDYAHRCETLRADLDAVTREREDRALFHVTHSVVMMARPRRSRVRRAHRCAQLVFSGAMVRAILAGTKTQTRRVVSARHDWYEHDGQPYYCDYVHGEPDPVPVPCPYGSPGDVLWVKETWAVFDRELRGGAEGYGVAWRATHPSPDDAAEWIDGPVDYEGTIEASQQWRQSIHMPRWVCRLRLRVTSVRVERLQDITEDDARAEGVGPLGVDDHTHAAKFRALWEPINGQRAPWTSNPRVWVVGFERIAGD